MWRSISPCHGSALFRISASSAVISKPESKLSGDPKHNTVGFNTLQDLCRFSSDPKDRAKLSGDPKHNTVGFNTLQDLCRFSSDPKARVKLSGNPKHNTVGFNTLQAPS